jgi:hypothetical protein
LLGPCRKGNTGKRSCIARNALIARPVGKVAAVGNYTFGPLVNRCADYIRE